MRSKLEARELMDMMKADSIGAETEETINKGDTLKTLKARFKFCKLAECVWLVNKDSAVGAA
jgi:hypothetical protein